MKICHETVADLVDRLSTPIQFMSLAEKRTKQMKGMGFDETDISDEALTSSSSSSTKQQPKPEQVPALPAASTANGKTATPTTSQSRAGAVPTAAASQQVSAPVDKKDKKGAGKFH